MWYKSGETWVNVSNASNLSLVHDTRDRDDQWSLECVVGIFDAGELKAVLLWGTKEECQEELKRIMSYLPQIPQKGETNVPKTSREVEE